MTKVDIFFVSYKLRYILNEDKLFYIWFLLESIFQKKLVNTISVNYLKLANLKFN